jgi:hypothetical protein
MISDAARMHAVRVTICRAVPDGSLRDPQSRPRRPEKFQPPPCAIGNMCSNSVHYLRTLIL